MEVFMHNLPLHLEEEDVKMFLAKHLHGQNFDYVQTNFAVHLHRPKRGVRARTGTFTVADKTVGLKFLTMYGLTGLPFWNNLVHFKLSNNPARPEILQDISRLPWINPVQEKERKKKEGVLAASSVPISRIQFGWHCRDDVHSIETETSLSARLCFDPQRRELHVVVDEFDPTEHIIAVRQSSIQSASRHFSSTFDHKYVLLLELHTPPTFLLREKTDSTPPLFGAPQSPKFSRMSTFPPLDNPQAVCFTSLVLRLVFPSKGASDAFQELADTAGLRYIHSDEVAVERRKLFSSDKLALLEKNLRKFNWGVAFQLASLLQNMILDTAELLSLLPMVRVIWKAKGKKYTAKFLREFGNRASALWFDEDSSESILSCFKSVEQDFMKQDDLGSLVPDDGSYYQSLHVTITPTTMLLEGPSPEQSNRVIRRYDSEHQESFLRVTFRDENRLQYRFDRDVDGPVFIKDRVGGFLKGGLQIAGRHFDFLAYSQSALKDHSVWFVKEFKEHEGGWVNAKDIIKSLGTFDNLAYDPTLMRCPARYAARISQAFTATDAAVVPVEEILVLEDIKTPDGKYVFTDGVGTMSQDLARAIWEELRAAKRKTSGKPSDYPHAYQVRYRGSKGMLSIDYTLNGSHTIGLRPSMTKFEAEAVSGDHEIEIARAFVRPTTYYLNRPLIMLLEGLGVHYRVFHDFQQQAVQETTQATKTLNKASSLLERHGLGSSFKLPSTMLSLSKLGLDHLYDDSFYTQILKISVHHVLRDLKHHARIPIPNAWTLVGVADAHGYLKEDQVFACVKHQSEGVIYLEGPVLVSRSPTIHPGDVQVVHAIGVPPEGSCFAKEPLYNTIVFSIKGSRPLPSCLGGGDLDGDIYNIIPLKDHPWFSPSQTYLPAEYAPTQRKLLDRPSTMEDVADFVMEYIISDVVGIIAINWLIIADQSEDGINDEDCLTLAQLHSDAVDYPKSGRAVNPRDIPRLKFKTKPDWNAPETINPDSSNYYQSQSAIGKLFRAIELDEIPTTSRPRRRRRRGDPRRMEALANSLSNVQLNDHVFQLVEPKAGRFLDTAGPWEESTISNVERLFKRFSTELTSIAVNYNLSHKNDMLSEEEVIVGTITQKTSQPRTRKEYMTKVRDMTDTLVKGIRVELEGDESRTLEGYLEYAWLAWRLSFTEANKNTFGAKSFGWLALGSIFDAMKLIEEHDAAELRSRRG